MPGNDLPPWAQYTWPAFAETWFGSTMYPSGRGLGSTPTGWVCAGCSRGWAPGIAQCAYCGPPQPATGGNVPGPPAPMGEWDGAE